jgi:hypothetical protein
MASFSREDDYLYTIKEDPTYYYTGTMTHGRQAVAVIYYPSVITVVFDEMGHFVDVTDKPLPESTKNMIDQRGFTEAFVGGADREILTSLRESGFREQPVKVRRFFLPRYHIGIRDFPETFCDVLANPSMFSPEERALAEQEAQRWSREGLFELWLNSDSYRWINRDGEVEAS